MPLSQYSVQGVIMIDTTFPRPIITDHYPRTVDEVASNFDLPCELSDIRRKQSEECILHAHEMHRDWRPPLFPHSGPPSTVLVRATDTLGHEEQSTHYLDLARSWKYLGWEEYGTSFILACLETPGHHFNLFEEHYVRYPSSKLMSIYR